jgi:ribosome-binding protein aMBF1 (putative translation factor)
MRKRHWKDRKNRKCPTCTRILTYTRKDSFDRAVGNNTVCKSCAQMDRKVTMDTIQKMQQPKSIEHKQKISVSQYKRSYNRYLLEVPTPDLSFHEFVEARKKGFKWQY